MVDVRGRRHPALLCAVATQRLFAQDLPAKGCPAGGPVPAPDIDVGTLLLVVRLTGFAAS